MSEVATEDQEEGIAPQVYWAGETLAEAAEAEGLVVSVEAPKLKRALFGHSTRSAKQILEERERAEVRARLGEQRVAELGARLAAARDRLGDATASIQAELSAAREELRRQSELARIAEWKAAEVQAELEAAREELRGRTEHAQLAERRIARLGAELQATREGITETVTALKAELSAAHEEIAARTEQARRVEAAAVDLRAELDATRDQLREGGAALQAELLAAREELAERSEQVRRAEARVIELEAALSASDGAPGFDGRKAPTLGPVEREDQGGPGEHASSARPEPESEGSLDHEAAQALAELARMLEAAGPATSVVERTWRRAQGSPASGFADAGTQSEPPGGWDPALGPELRSVHAAIGATRAGIEEVPGRIRDALEPMAEAIGRLGDSIDRLADVSAACPAGDSPRALILEPGGIVDDERPQYEGGVNS